MNETTIKELNTILKGEHMAVKSYEKFISDLKDEYVRDYFNEVSDDHKKHAQLIANRIKELGGDPAEGTGLAGIMTDMSSAIKNLTKRSTLDILKDAYNGEDRGIGKTEEIVKGDLDEKSAVLINKILSEDHDHLKKISDMISKYEQKS